MNQALNARLQLRKSAKGSQTHNGCTNHCANRIFFGCQAPRIRNQLFQAERNLFLLRIYAQNINLNLIALFQNVGRLINSVPSHLGNVQQAINTAQIHKSAKAGQTRNYALAYLALGNLSPDSFLLFLLFFQFQLFRRKQQAVFIFITFNNFSGKLFADINLNIINKMSVQLRIRHKTAHANIHQHAAFNSLNHFAGNHAVFLFKLQQLIPNFNHIDHPFGNHRITLFVFLTNYNYVKFIANVEFLPQIFSFLSQKLVARQNAL